MNEDVKKFNKIKYVKLILALIIDLVGYLSYLVPALGESTDLFWGPMSGVLILILFPDRKLWALSGGIEEMIPMTDFVPTALITWWIEYYKNKEKSWLSFKNKELLRKT